MMDEGFEGGSRKPKYAAHQPKCHGPTREIEERHAPKGMGGSGKVVGDRGKGRSWANGPMHFNKGKRGR